MGFGRAVPGRCVPVDRSYLTGSGGFIVVAGPRVSPVIRGLGLPTPGPLADEAYLRVIAPPGTVVNPVMPAAVAARGLTGFRMANAVFGALAQIAPDRVFACEVGGDTGVSFGGYDAERRPFVFLEFLFGSWAAARPRTASTRAAARS